MALIRIFWKEIQLFEAIAYRAEDYAKTIEAVASVK